MSHRRLTGLAGLIAVVFGPDCGAQTTWSQLSARTSHAMTAGPDGLVYIHGGRDLATAAGLNDAYTLEGAAWSFLASRNSPPTRSGHTLGAVDTGLDGPPILVIFGGISAVGSTVRDDTFTRRPGDIWIRSTLSIAPAPRTDHAMVNDPVRGVVILFGGAPNARSDTWEFDGFAWTQMQPASPPPGRSNHAMAWDESTGTVLMYGGNGPRNDVWEYVPPPAGPIWRQIATATSAPARLDHAMAYHRTLDTVILFGGRDGTTVFDDTWRFDRALSDWVNYPTPSSPPAVSDHAMATESTGQVVLLGGERAAGGELDQIFRLSGQPLDWRTPEEPNPRVDHAMAHDSAAGTTVLFGGRDLTTGILDNNTWHLDGASWTVKSRGRPNEPGNRADHAMSYDVARNRVVLFGGRRGNPCSPLITDGVTWEWDGNVWGPVRTSDAPPGSGGGHMVYDIARSVSWLLTSHRTIPTASRMWAYDGVDWRPGRVPVVAAEYGFAYDAVRGQLVKFGGETPPGSTIPSSTTELWNGGAWTTPSPNTVPPARYSNAMQFDPVRGNTVMFGGFDSGGNELGDTWTWDGSDWTPRGAGPSPRASHSMAWDPQRGEVVLFGGVAHGQFLNETWLWNGNSWSEVFPATRPAARALTSMAYDPATGDILMFGGRGHGGYLADTWLWTRSDWVRLTPATPMVGRLGHALASWPTGNGVVMFGGFQAPPTFEVSETWTWNGADWTRRTGLQPEPRHKFGMVEDPVAGRVLLHGGLRSATGYADLWQWTVRGWEPLDSGPPQFPRLHYHAAYDLRRDRVVLYGGMTSCDAASARFLADTWEWDGQRWLQRYPPNSPGRRARGSMEYDAQRGRVVLLGGQDDLVEYNDTWEWDGETWTRRLPDRSPPPGSGHAAVFDSRTERVVSFGPQGLWSHGASDTAGLVEFAAATCNDIRLGAAPGGGPWLDTLGAGGPFRWFMEIDVSAPAGTTRPGVILLGVAPLSAPLPIGNGCTLAIDAIPGLAIDFVAPGRAIVDIPVNDRTLLGVEVFAQGIALLPNRTFVSSQGVILDFGER